MTDKITKVGIVGTGFIAKGLAHLIRSSNDFQISKILTRRPINSISDFPHEYLTNSINELIDASDIMFECSGDAIHATEAVLVACNANKMVVTINSEFHVTTGSYFAKKGFYVTEADGDQPGCLARLKLEIEGMGFEPIAYVNLKGFLNPNPTPDEMKYWSDKQQLALDQVISFTDGTKLQIEQAFVANGLDATLASGGIIGARVESLSDLDFLVSASEQVGAPISDFVLCNGSPPGVLIVAKNKIADLTPGYLPFSRLSTKEGSGYVLLRTYHLCHLEALNTLRRVVRGEPILLNNSATPRITVVAVAKRKILRGDVILRGAGGFDARGLAVKLHDNRDAVPICLLQNTRVIRDIEQGQTIKFDDVELLDTKALQIYKSLASG